MSEHKKSVWKEGDKPKSRKMAMLVFGPLVLIILGVGFYLFGDRYISTDNAYVKAGKVSISAEVTGKIIKVNVKDNSRVAKGDELFMIDPEPFQIAVSRSEANLGNVRTEIESIRSGYLQKLAELTREEDTVRYRESEYKRYKDLAAKNAIPEERRDQALHDFNAAEKDRDAAKQDAESLKAQLGGNTETPTEQHPRFMQAKAELEKAQLDLSRIKIVAPVDGVAANVTLQPGEFTAAGLPLFTIVNDSAPWIEANFKETDLTHVRVGQDAEIEVDTYPGVTWKAKVASITPATGSEFSILPPQNSSGNWVKVVQRIMVRLELEHQDAAYPLGAGMSVHVTVDTGATRLQRRSGQNAGNIR